MNECSQLNDCNTIWGMRLWLRQEWILFEVFEMECDLIELERRVWRRIFIGMMELSDDEWEEWKNVFCNWKWDLWIWDDVVGLYGSVVMIYVCDRNSAKTCRWLNETLHDDANNKTCEVIPYIM